MRGGIGTGSRGVGLLGGIFTYAIRDGIIEKNPVHGFRKPKDRVRDRRLTEREYRVLGKILADAADEPQWEKLVKDTPLESVTPHVLRHSFASVANDLGFTESTIAALVGHSRGTITSRYIHTVDTALVMAGDTVASYIQALLDGVKFERANYALDHSA